MKTSKQKKTRIRIKFYIQKLFNSYLKKRLLIPSLHPTGHNKELSAQLTALFLNELRDLKISTTFGNNQLNELLHFQIHKSITEKILKSEYKKGLNSFKRIISSLEPLEYKDVQLTIIKRDGSIIGSRVFDKRVWHSECPINPKDRLCVSVDCQFKVDIEISVPFEANETQLVDTTERVIFKFPVVMPPATNSNNIKRLRCPLNEYSIIKDADKKSKIFDEEFILQIKTSERIVTSFAELSALNEFNEAEKGV